MTERYLGLMSGTSADGIDCVIAEFDGDRYCGLAASRHVDYPPMLRQRLLAVSVEQPALTPREFVELDAAIGTAFAQAAQTVIASSKIDPGSIVAIGSHGQTLFHDGPAGLSLQMGDPHRVAAATGITTVADFRRLDLALGGQGAPLAPAFHRALFATPSEDRVVLNLGGIANITLLPKSASAPVIGFDTGPASGLMDEWMQQRHDQPFDRGGAMAASGQPDEALVDALLADPYFRMPAPKSTGRDYFRLDWAAARFPSLRERASPDVMASLAEVTIRSIADAIRDSMPTTTRVIVCGGGARNTRLMDLLANALPGAAVVTSDAHALPPEWIEATAFAWLAMRRMRGESGNLVAVTGARRAASLGAVILAPRG